MVYLYQIRRFSVHQTSKVAAAVYFGLGIVLLPFFLIAMLAGNQTGTAGTAKPSPLVLLLLPALYAGVGYLTTALLSHLFNITAKRIGGIEMEIISVGPAPPDDATTAIPSVVPPDARLH